MAALPPAGHRHADAALHRSLPAQRPAHRRRAVLHAILATALESAARRSARLASVESQAVGRYEPELELAVYFCCLEALQNADKHAGPDACTTIRLWQDGPAVRFEVRDAGRGFDLADAERRASDPLTPSGTGLQNMRDRIGAVGGVLSIRSAPGGGTSVSGAAPVTTAPYPASKDALPSVIP